VEWGSHEIVQTLRVLGCIAASVLASNAAVAGTANGAPSGAHYNLNIIGVKDPKSADMTFDFGKSVQGELIKHDFQVTNEGTTPRRIAKVMLTPPLLATRVPGEIAPGATAAVHTQLDTSRLQGSFSGEIVVYVRGNDAPLTTLVFEGVVVTPIEVSPVPAFFVVGQRGQGAERAIDVINHEAQPLRIKGVDHGAPVFSTRLDTVQPGQHYRLVLKLRPDGPAGKRTDVVTLRTSSANTPTLRIPVHTNLRERVYAFPDAMDLGALKLSIIRSQPDLLAAIAQTLMVYQTGETIS
jgi:hypothetical protein